MLKSLVVIAIGSSLGAWLRWLLGMKLNALFPTIPQAQWLQTWFGATSLA